MGTLVSGKAAGKTDEQCIGIDLVNDVGDVADRRRDDRLDGCRVQAVGQVVLLEHKGRGDHHGAQLGERQGHEPELIVSLEYENDLVALADAQ